jgi:immunity protein Imm1 of predicted polymorphic toxin system
MVNHAIIEVCVGEPGRTIAFEELRIACDRAQQAGYSEISVSRGTAGDDRFPVLCALISGDRGWLMYLRYEGDAGFHSNSPDRPTSERTIEFELSNGQVDEYPEAWTLSTDEVVRALRHFAENGNVPEPIHWSNDSGDNCAGPNDRNFQLPEWA